jgi:hypothetical protein
LTGFANERQMLLLKESISLYHRYMVYTKGIFQRTIIKLYAKSYKKQILEAWERFSAYFHNPKIQENLRIIKEEQFQEGFLRELFVKVLGYTLFPEPNHNLITEKKNETNAKKADGAVVIDGEVKAVIELKDGKTTDLATVQGQAFDYKNSHRNVSYVIISNFEKLRFYIDNHDDYVEFNLFTLTEEEFTLLWLCLALENQKTDLPKKIKNESVSREEQITKKLYNDYSGFKRALFIDITEKNPGYDKLELFKKTQKLLDRFLFLLFAEDMGLLPPNSISLIIEEWEKLKELDEYRPLYERLKKYFEYLNTGHKGKSQEIFAYNGGLFLSDEILDCLIINDEVLRTNLLLLSQYDYNSEVDVNILGHIFENSLSEIEEISKEINAGETVASKRKKDGVFYTPRYITSYIVDNTIGKLCTDKKMELDINEEEYFADKKRQLKSLKKLSDKLEKYQIWLLGITICDPACGSGAFLNAALDFLIKEHSLIDEMNAKIHGDTLVLSNIENSILENNLFGVDINEESVEIARLALWLRTAKPRRKLNSLSNNIKCGNSLISDPAVDTEKAFDWQKEFPQILSKGGFDMVIGNPPYGILIDKNIQQYYVKNFPLTQYKTNLYVLFIERMLQIFKNGIIHFIIPKSLLFNTYFESIRKELILKTEIKEIFTITEKVFPDAEVGGSLLLQFIIKSKPDIKNSVKLINAEKIVNFTSGEGLIKNQAPQNSFLNVPNCEISIVSSDTQSIVKKLMKFKPLNDYYNLRNGLNPGNVKYILISNKKESEKHKPIIWGKEISRYRISWGGQYINYDVKIGEKIAITDIRSKEGMNKQNRIDFALRTPDIFEVKKIVVRKTGDSIIAALDNNNYYFDTLVHGIYKKENNHDLESLLALLNSKPTTVFYRMLHDIKGKTFAKISLDNLAAFPIPADISNLKYFTDEISTLTTHLGERQNIFLNRLRSNFTGININSILEKFYTLEFGDFTTELKKQKISLTLKQQDDWETYFTEYKNECLLLERQVVETEAKINELVYSLYGLSKEEIKIVESSDLTVCYNPVAHK